MSSSRALLIPLAVAALAGCGGDPRSAASDSANPADSSVATIPAPLPPDSAVAWKFTPPDSWKERTVAVFVSAEDRAKYFQNARSAQRFDYLPQDSSVAAQTLLLITVYDSAAWGEIEKQDGPPVGDVIARERGMVYVASLPQSNPFADGTPDYAAFEARSVTIDQVKKGFQVVSP